MPLTKVQEDVHDFMVAMGQDTPTQPTPYPTNETIDLRIALIREETHETLVAIKQLRARDEHAMPVLAEIADGIADSIYVLIGTALAFGIDMNPVWEAVQAANMLKTTGPVRADGKRLKPPGFTPPDIEAIITTQLFGQNHDAT
jgi:predicted HAD superfamily Cof-like phosphohydrolase